MPHRKEITFDRFIRISLVVAGVILGLMLINRLSSVLLPFFIAWIISYMIYPLVKFFQYKLRLKNRALSIGLALLSISAICGVIFYFVLPPIITEAGRVKDLIVYYVKNGGEATGYIPAALQELVKDYVDFNALSNLLDHQTFINTIQKALPQLWALISESVSFLINLFTFFIILLYVVFILIDYESLAEGWIYLLPEKYRNITQRVVLDVQHGMNRYFRGQALVALIVGVLFSIGFLIIDFPLAIGLGLLIGALNMVPYLQIVGFIPTIILAILKTADTGGNFWVIFGSALAVFAIVQIIQDSYLTPKIMGKITGLNPAIILLSLSIWGSLMGMLGMIIALPLTTLLLSYYQRFIINKEKIFQQMGGELANLEENDEDEKINEKKSDNETSDNEKIEE